MGQLVRVFCAIGLSLVLALLSPAPVGATPNAEESPAGWSNQLIITYVAGVTPSAPAAGRIVRVAGQHAIVDLGRRAVPSDLTNLRLPGVLSVEPDLWLRPTVTPSDPSFGSQWDMSDAAAGAADYSVRAPGAWDLTTGNAGLVVAVIDTGITTHSEFTGRTVAGYDMISDARIGNDGSARDADPSDPGDWITSAENTSGFFARCGVSNSSWHGTHVAGTIGASANNGKGIAGLNWVSKIQPVRALGKCGGYLSDIADAITWASGGTVSGIPVNTTPARVINLSLGGSGSCDTYMQSAITGARARNSIVVVAAGNSNSDVSQFTPANCAGVVAVAATGRNGKRAYYSNFGSLVDIAAPGGNSQSDSKILSTLNTGTQGPVAESYAAYQGTSMAAPHIAGVLSLLLSLHPELNETGALNLMSANATIFPADAGTNPCSTAGNCGAGIINATAMLAASNGISLKPQTISFPAQPDRVLGEASFAPGATASSGLPVIYSSSTIAACTTNGQTVTLISTGTCTITASQAGDASWLPASSVSRSFSILARPTASINAGANWTKNTSVTLSLTLPPIANVVEVSNVFDFSTLTSYARITSTPWTLDVTNGIKTVYVRVSGGTMVSPVVVSDTIGLDTIIPTVTSATASGKKASTITYTFSVSASDENSGLQSIQLSTDGGSTIAATLAYASSFTYKSSSRTFHLRVIDNAGNASTWRAVGITLR